MSIYSIKCRCESLRKFYQVGRNEARLMCSKCGKYAYRGDLHSKFDKIEKFVPPYESADAGLVEDAAENAAADALEAAQENTVGKE